MNPVRHSFKAMGTTVSLITPPDSPEHQVSRAMVGVMNAFAREETRFSRFRTDSELSQVNAQAGAWVAVSEAFMTVTRLALEAAKQTDGLFDPTVLPALKAAGYDRDFGEISARSATPDDDDEDLQALRKDFRDLMVKDATTCGRWNEIGLLDDRVRLPLGVELDFGGIAKGWTVDRAAESLPELPWAIVDAGGDLRLVGRTPEGGLDIAIEDPEVRGVEALRVKMETGALATTSVKVRSWGRGMHHVIDPRTSLPALTGVLQATVWGDTCAQAEVWSKAAVLTGPAILDRVPASIVLESGEVVTNFAEANL